MQRSLLAFSASLFALASSAQTVTDIDGNVYNTVVIGDREWMTENLVTTHYQDGTPIPHISNNTTWFNLLVTGARCFYFNDSATYNAGYGTLYNWNAVSNPANLCPAGFHVPSDADWNAMTTFLDPTVDPDYQGFIGTGTDIGDQLKEAGTAFWDLGNDATNSSGFGARGAGYRRGNGNYEYLNHFGYFWTSTYGELGKAWCRVLDNDSPQISRFILDRLYGASVRCVSDATTGMKEEQGRSIRLFPNPASDVLYVQSDLSASAKLTVHDAQGRVLLSHSLAAGLRTVDIAALPAGVYIVHITDGGPTKREVLVKQ